MSNSLEERLRANSNAFDGLLALIPAKYYYDENTQDQWKAKKKSKDQARDDKAKKLDPTAQSEDASTALDIMKKREADAKPVVLPGQRLKAMREAELKRSQQAKTREPVEEEEGDAEESKADIKLVFDDEGNEVKSGDDDAEDSENSPVYETEGEKHAAIKEAKTKEQKQADEEAKAKKQKNLDALRAKLQTKIQSMKSKRKAPGSKADGAPASREAILKQRQHREELKSKRKQQGNGDDDSDSDAGSDDENDDMPAAKKQKRSGDDDEINADGVIFQNIMFDDGDRATSDLQRIRRGGKKKGPAKKDLKAHIKLLEAKRSKLEARDELDQIKQKEKDKWQRTMLQTEGVKIKDDEKLLRKALKRKEAKKRKSAVEWDDRKRMVADTKAERVKRREENLQIRKDNRGVKRSKQQKMKRKFKGVVNPKKRAGFEGRLKSGKGRK